jgi:hypothetical protein
VSLSNDSSLRRHYNEDILTGQIGSDKAPFSPWKKAELIFNDPLHADIGIGSLQLGVSLQRLNTYLASGGEDFFSLASYTSDYKAFASDLMSLSNSLTVNIEALDIQLDQAWLQVKYGTLFTSAAQATQDALMVVVNKLGIAQAAKIFPAETLPDPTGYTGGLFVEEYLSKISPSLATACRNCVQPPSG